MYEENEEEDDASMLDKSEMLLQRSKSYDARLNYVYENSVYYANNNTNLDNNNTTELDSDKKNNLKQRDPNDSTQIIVTSFAPDPKTKNLIRTTIQTRPISQQVILKSVETTEQPIASLQGTAPSISNYTNIKPDLMQEYKRRLNIIWQDGKNNPPLIIFSAKVLRKTCWECKKIGEQFRMTYKFQNGEKKLVKSILDGHGFKEAHPNSSEFNIIWTGNNLKSYAFRSLQESQKVNHFPRSCELTRKDRLYKNVQRMQKEKGSKVFNMLPTTFVMPFEIDDFYNTFNREKGIWIVKPVSLSRGRGIYLINHPDQIPLEDNLVVSKYITNPFLIEGFKFDIRLYVAVTSFDPLVFYLYEEGLTRFATVKYDQNLKNIKNICMHLTNYSLNKKSENFVRCSDPDVEDYGNKWTMSALLRYLSAQGKDTFTLMMNIEEAIIKTMLAVESPLASATRMFVPNRTNCFELFGFDILIDEEMKPWVLEVNLSPSLDCDALLDIRVKSQMISDLFTLTGIYCTNPNNFSSRSRLKDKNNTNSVKNDIRVRPHSAGLVANNQKQNQSTNNNNSNLSNSSNNTNTITINTTTNNNNNNNTTTPTTNTPTTNTTNNIVTTTNTNTITTNTNNIISNNNIINNYNQEYKYKPGDPLYEGLNQNEADILKTVINENARSEKWVRLFPTSDTWEFYSQYLENRSTSYNMMIHKKLFSRRWTQNTVKKATNSRARGLQTLNENFKDKTLYNSPEITGASLNEALTRYRRYERKLDDQVKPCEETLKRLSTSTSLQQLQQQQQQQLHNSLSTPNPSLRSNFTAFPKGESYNTRSKNISVSSNEEESMSMNDQFNNSNNNEPLHPLPPAPKPPAKPVYQIQPNGCLVPKKPMIQPNLASMIKQDKKSRYILYGEDYVSSDDSENESNHKTKNGSMSSSNNNNNNNNDKPVNEIKYDLETVLKYLDQGYYLSRIQVRNAFALYLFKIHVRLVTESQNKDESNVQQMELVLRFIRKAAPNLSQEFQPYTPSRRLPMSEQKRMLAKQLHDFLHIYRKDTGQIRIDMSNQLDEERKKYRRKLIDEKAFQTLLYKCCESELEEIMSVYMKNSLDSSVFLGSNKNLLALNESNNNNNNEVIDFNLTSNQDKPKTASIALKSALVNNNNNTKNKPISSLNIKQQQQRSETTKQPYFRSDSLSNRINTNVKLNPTTTTSKKSVMPITAVKHQESKKGNQLAGEDDLSGLSCDSNSGFSNSSTGSVKNARSRSASRSVSRSTSVSSVSRSKKKHQNQRQQKQHPRDSKSAAAPPHRLTTAASNTTSNSTTTKTNSPVNLKTSALINEKNSKTFTATSINTNNSTLLNAKKYDYETIIKNIYLNTTHKFPLSNSTNSTSNSSKKVRPITSVINNNNNNNNKSINQLSLIKETTKNNNNNNVLIQKHSNNSHNNSIQSNETYHSYYNSNNNLSNSLSNGLKSLTLRKQERVYSATKSAFKLASSLNNTNESNDELSDNNNNNTNLKLVQQQAHDSRLIDHLERQKEHTNKLLQKSKQKHNEMISMSIIQN